MTENFLSFAAPHITIDGELKSELTRDLVFLKVSEGLDGMRTLEARFIAFGPTAGADHDDLLYLNGEVFDFGSDIEVEIGPEENRLAVFNGRVSAIEAEFEEGHEPEVTVRGEDELMAVRLNRRMKVYENMSDADIAADIADENGIDSDVDAQGPSYDVIHQWNMSDLAFLRDRARRIQADLWFSDGTLNFKSRSSRSASELSLVQGNQLIEIKACADLAHQRTAVRVCGYDAAERSAIDETAQGDVIQSEAPDGRTGPDIVAEVFSGDRISYRLRDVPLNSDEASAWARAEMLRRARSFVRVRGCTRGSPEMNVGSRLTLEGVGTPFEGGDYYVTSVCHDYDLARGYRTRFEAERGAVGVRS